MAVCAFLFVRRSTLNWRVLLNAGLACALHLTPIVTVGIGHRDPTRFGGLRLTSATASRLAVNAKIGYIDEYLPNDLLESGEQTPGKFLATAGPIGENRAGETPVGTVLPTVPFDGHSIAIDRC